MATRLARLLAAATALIFALLAFIFCVLAIASKEWAVRDGYPYGLNDWNWTQPEFTLYRSPFAVCYATANSTRKPFGFNSTCIHYRPSGFGKTSCELAIATGSDTVPQIGDQRQCQQIHWAGDFGITSVVFTTLGFTAMGLLVLATIFTGSHDHGEGSTGITSSHRHGSHKQHVAESSPADELAPAPSGKPRFSRFHHHRSVLVPYVNLMLLVFLSIGIITSLISQFYAVEGLVQSAPNNADFASASGNRDNPNTKGNHGPWYQGKALSVYMTCSWGFALAAGVVASRVWRLPNWDVGV